jgi:hypothetical protein
MENGEAGIGKGLGGMTEGNGVIFGLLEFQNVDIVGQIEKWCFEVHDVRSQILYLDAPRASTVHHSFFLRIANFYTSITHGLLPNGRANGAQSSHL